MKAGCTSDRIKMYFLIPTKESIGITLARSKAIRHTEVRSQALRAPSIAQLVSSRKLLQLQMAALKDNDIVIKTCYDLEGDRLEILLAHEKIEALRTKGRLLSTHGSMETVDALIRAKAKIVTKMKLKKHWDQTDNGEAGDYTAEIISITKIRSVLHPGKEVNGYKIKYDAD